MFIYDSFVIFNYLRGLQINIFLLQAEHISQRNGDGVASRGIEVVFFRCRENISEAVVISTLEHDVVFAFDRELNAGAGTDTVVKTSGDVHLHLLGGAVGRGESLDGAYFVDVEVGVDIVAYHVAELRPEVKETFDFAATEEDMGHDRQLNVGERVAVAELGCLGKILGPSALGEVELGANAYVALLGPHCRYAHRDALMELLLDRRVE